MSKKRATNITLNIEKLVDSIHIQIPPASIKDWEIPINWNDLSKTKQDQRQKILEQWLEETMLANLKTNKPHPLEEYFNDIRYRVLSTQFTYKTPTVDETIVAGIYNEIARKMNWKPVTETEVKKAM